MEQSSSSSPEEEVDFDREANARRIYQRPRRKWAPKVKTGCHTCRTRKLKCDEAKPACERCISGGYTCTGLGYGMSSPISLTESVGKNVAHPPPRKPSAVPQLDGTSEIRDLILIGPLVASRVDYPHPRNPGDVKLDFLVGRMRRLSSYIYYIPTRSGRSSTLDNIVACTAIALRTLNGTGNRTLQPSTWQLYGEAVRGLRSDLQSNERSLLPETLCATELLGYFESLVSDNRHVIMKHSQGTMQLIHHRGPERLTSEFEKSLLASQVMNIAMKAMMEGSHSYLGQDPWVRAVRSLVSLDPMNHPDRSEIKLSFVELAVRATNLLKDCSDLYLDQRTRSTEQIHTRHRQLLHEATEYREAVLLWLRTWDSELYSPGSQSGGGSVKGLGQSGVQMSLSVKVAVIVCCRFLTALGSDQGVALEEEARQAAQDFLDQLDNTNTGMGGVNAGIARAVASAILSTTAEWHAFASDQDKYASDGFKLIPAATYFRWTSRTGIQLPDGYDQVS